MMKTHENDGIPYQKQAVTTSSYISNYFLLHVKANTFHQSCPEDDDVRAGRPQMAGLSNGQDCGVHLTEASNAFTQMSMWSIESIFKESLKLNQ